MFSRIGGAPRDPRQLRRGPSQPGSRHHPRAVLSRTMLVSALLLLVVGCDALEEYFGSWDGYVYPDRSDLTRHIYIGRFKTLEECRAAAFRTIAARSHVSRADYECGLNCKSRDGFNVCSRTER